MGKLVQGVGISEKGEFARYTKVNGKKIMTKEYQLWSSMLKRCYSEKCQQEQPTYLGCSVGENFKYFQRFAKWCQSQIGFGLEGWQLDKDILIRGNKVYSEDTCVFVPRKINCMLVKQSPSRGEFPIGVSWFKRDKNYKAQCNDGNGTNKHLGYSATPEGAFQAYKEFKEVVIKRLAVEYIGTLDPRAYDALMKYEVNIND